MNTKIYNLILKNLEEALNLPKYDLVRKDLTPDTIVLDLPWTPARLSKFMKRIEDTLGVESYFEGSIEDIVNELDVKYSSHFFGEVWKPRTDAYGHTGWGIVDKVNNLNPKQVLDVGCGYNQFKSLIPNLIGIDPYNSNADYQVDILEYAAVEESFDAIIAFGSINFNSKEDIEARIANCVKLLAPGGSMFFRVNPGIQHEEGPWVDVFAWNFELAHEFAKKFSLNLIEYKKDANNRLYFKYQKPL